MLLSLMYIEIAEYIVHEKIPEVKTIGRNAIYHEFPWRTWWGHLHGAAADSCKYGYLRLTEPILLSNISTIDYKRRPLLPSSGINVIPLPLGISR